MPAPASRFLLGLALVWRPLRHDLGRTALSLLAVALGVAVVVAIRIANRGAIDSFASTTRALAGPAALVASGPAPITAASLASLGALGAAVDASPYLDRQLVDGSASDTLELLGVEITPAGDGLWLAPAYARRHGYTAGSTMQAIAGGIRRPLRIAGVWPGLADGLALLDLPSAQALLATTTFDGLRLRLPSGASGPAAIAGIAPRLQALLPPPDTVAPPATRVAQDEKMLAAFHANLDALSWVSLLVGIFLIYNTVSISVVRRRTAVAAVRALGVTRGAVLRLFLLEGLAIALVGALAGLALGRALAAAVLRLVSGTVANLFAASPPAAARLTAGDAAWALALAAASGFFAALAPARQAAASAPALALRPGAEETIARSRRRPLLLAAFACAAAALLLPRLPEPGGVPLFGFLDALAVFGIWACLAAPLLGALLPRLRRFCLHRAWLAAGLAAGSLAGALRRTTVLTIALATAVGVMFGVAIMVGSFRQTVAVWIADQLRADVFVRAADWNRQHPAPLPPAWIAQLAATPGVDGIEASRTLTWQFQGEPILVNTRWWIAAPNALAARAAGPDYRFLAGAPFPGGALVSEPFARRFHAWPGATIALATPAGPLSLPVAAVFYDYAGDRGELVLSPAQFTSAFGAPVPSEVAFYATAAVGSAELARRMRLEIARLPPGAAVPALSVFDNASLRAAAMAVFDQTFRITWALEAITLLVAILGAANTLLAVVLERRRELALLRCLGATRAQTRRLLLAESGWVATLALLLGSGFGLSLAVVLVRVINVQSFGWTIQVHPPLAFLASAAALVWIATLAAGWLPAQAALRGPGIRALTAE